MFVFVNNNLTYPIRVKTMEIPFFGKLETNSK